MKRFGKVLLAFALAAAMMIPGIVLASAEESKPNWAALNDLAYWMPEGTHRVILEPETPLEPHTVEWICDRTEKGEEGGDALHTDPSKGDNGQPTAADVIVLKNWDDYAVGYVRYDNEEHDRHFVFAVKIQKCTSISYFSHNGEIIDTVYDPDEEYRFAAIDPVEIISGDETLVIYSFNTKYDPATNKTDKDKNVLSFSWKEDIIDENTYDEPTFPDVNPGCDPLNVEGHTGDGDDDIDHTAGVPTGQQTIYAAVTVSLSGLLAQPDTTLVVNP